MTNPINDIVQALLFRARPMVIEEGIRPFNFASPEDIILHKLVWYKMGDGISRRQWNDIPGVLNQQGDALDLAYLHLWSEDLDVAMLLERALTEVNNNDQETTQAQQEKIESYLETQEILNDDEAMAAFRQGVEDIKAGKLIAWEDVKKELGLE